MGLKLVSSSNGSSEGAWIPQADKAAVTQIGGWAKGSPSGSQTSSFVLQLDWPGDTKPNKVHTPPMNDITREEFNARLEAIEARMDARIESVSSKIDSFLATQSAVQIERDKAQAERDRRLEMLAERATKAAEGAEEAAKQAATVKANYWAAVGVQLLAVVAVLVGAYYANQANVFGAMQTTMAAFTTGKDFAKPAEASSPPAAATKK